MSFHLLETGDKRLLETGDSLLLEGPVDYPLTATSTAYSFATNASNLLIGRVVTAAATAYTFAGVSVGMTLTRLLVADTISYALAGPAVGLSTTRLLPASTATYALSAPAAVLSKGYGLTADSATYALTGTSTGLLATRQMPADLVTYALSASATVLSKGYGLTADPASYALSGSTTGLLATHLLPATVASYALSGSTTGLLATHLLPATVASYALSGSTTGLTKGFGLIADPTAYALSGVAVGFPWAHVLSTTTASFGLAGSSANLTHNTTAPSATGSYALTLNAAGLRRTYVMSANVRTFALSGVSSALDFGHLIAASPLSILVNMNAAAFARTYVMPATSSAFVLAAPNAALRVLRRPTQTLPPPNWRVSVKDKSAFFTEILTTRSGKEQRRAMRATARRNISYEGLVDFESLRDLGRTMAGLRAADIVLPDFLDGIPLAAPVAVGSNTITIAARPAWATIGVKVALVSGRRVETRTISGTSSTTLTFVDPATDAWFGNTLLCRLLTGRPSNEMRATRLTNAIGPVDVDFDVTPTSLEADAGDQDIGHYFNGYEVFMARPNWTTAPTVSYLNPSESVDFGWGRTVVSQAIDFNSQTRSATYLQRSAAEVTILRRFFNRMRGQQGEFYLPTWEPDLVLAQDVAAGDVNVCIAGVADYFSYANDTVHQAIAVTLRSGYVFLRTIDHITQANGQTVLVLTEPWPFDMPAADVRMISWMPLTRFASDDLTFEWLTNQVAQTTVSFRHLEAQISENAALDLDGAGLFMISTYGWDFTREVFINPLHWAMNVRLPEIFA